MNILIPDSWLRDYLETKANPEKIGRCLSLCGASVERIKKENNDSIYDIEITSNRVDMASVKGIARETVATLPQFNIKASLKQKPYQNFNKEIKKNKKTKSSPKLKVFIKDKKLCPRFTAILFDNISIKPSPKIIQERLEKAGIRSLNNVIDISNYLMRELGQPVHIFDYDKIAKKTMILRESQKGEKITTLDGKTHNLPGKDIVIEDGKGILIDLCGIMGAQNSAVDNKTKRILLFIQNYEPTHIRRTSMLLAHRTEAANLFEKKIDPELVMPTLNKGIQLIKELSGGKIASKIIDLYPSPLKEKAILLPIQLIKDYLGISIQLNKVINILKSLGFKIKEQNIKQGRIKAIVPSWRYDDISLPQDLIEEISRIYGYHHLPSQLPLGILPQRPAKQTFSFEEEIKNSLVDWGYTEIKNYSMQNKKNIENRLLNPKDHLSLGNPLTKEWAYMRRSLIPSFLNTIKNNEPKKVKFFELGKIFIKQNGKLPKEKISLVIGQNQKHHYYYLKGIMEILFEKFKINNYDFKINPNNFLFNSQKSAQIFQEKQLLGFLGEINPQIINNFNIKNPVAVLQLDFLALAKSQQTAKKFKPLIKYESIIEDLSFELLKPVFYTDFVKLIKSCSPLIKKISLLDSFQNKRTFKILYQDPKKNLSNQEVSYVRQKIIKNVEEKGWGKLKGSAKARGLAKD